MNHVAATDASLVVRGEQPDDLRLDRAGEASIVPDIVLTERGTIRAAFDAKYKRHHAQSDVYQMLAYARGMGLPRVTLGYPADGEAQPATHRVLNDDIEVLVRTIPVAHRGGGFRGPGATGAGGGRGLAGEATGASIPAQAA